MFCTIWVHSGPFGCHTILGAKESRTSAKVCATKSLRNFSQRTHPIRPIGPKTNVSVCFVLFGCRPFGCLTKLDAKQGELVQKLVPQSHVGIFCNECSRSTPLDPKLVFWCVSNYLGAFRTICLPYETRCKMGRTSARTSAKVRATK